MATRGLSISTPNAPNARADALRNGGLKLPPTKPIFMQRRLIPAAWEKMLRQGIIAAAPGLRDERTLKRQERPLFDRA